MAKMYVANCSTQALDFQYRVPGTNKTVRLPIPIGEQRLIPDDPDTKVIESIIQQHSIYGMVAVQEIDRTRAFAGYCYSLDKPVPIAAIQKLLHSNHHVLDARGQRIREEASVAVAQRVSDELKDLGRRADRSADLTGFEVSIVEEEREGNDRRVDETILVDPALQAKAPIRGKGRIPARARA